MLSVEGAKTEPQYFKILDDSRSVIHIECIKGRRSSSPSHVLARMRTRLEKEDLRKGDEAWLVVDTDSWTDDQLGELHKWPEETTHHKMAVSNPKFEYWLLLHFEDGNRVHDGAECSKRLKAHVPSYDKGVNATTITREMIHAAVDRAKRRDKPPCRSWPRKSGCTTVYRLVEKILSHE